MKTLFLSILSALLVVGSPLFAHINWSSDYQATLKKAEQTSKPVVIFFTGTGWCSWCTKLEKEVLEKPEFEQTAGKEFLFLKADFPDYSEEAIAKSPYQPLLDRYNVEGFPTLVIVDHKGNKLFSMGYEEGGAVHYSKKLVDTFNTSK